jgi:hypothetical protein
MDLPMVPRGVPVPTASTCSLSIVADIMARSLARRIYAPGQLLFCSASFSFLGEVGEKKQKVA